MAASYCCRAISHPDDVTIFGGNSIVKVCHLLVKKFLNARLLEPQSSNARNWVADTGSEKA
ncbi:hypothetical protein H6S82_08160 [Planktothrix sp. FACHB-1355]|uniref:Uncharacterized protein n=1 Tax=Aerosakkonema funiforme FACHB-1375 TaxID=2949571 RepID=A0A926VF06_9CYAN|nr:MULTISPECIES: hypothetical protein [Oscillatoriales]MBD2182681.1 hypothetical protein [Aerosakkonema funiforme FACHB-1375]MBD3558829.1 hypothetical protein [Planktothrix sp. FACHB-1355]